MSLIQQRISSIDGLEVRVGQQWPQRSPALTFELAVRCASVQPESFVGVVSFDGERLFETKPVSGFDRALADAGAELRQRVRSAITVT